MDVLKLFDWKNSTNAIEELEKLLRCHACGKIADTPQCLGRCDHFFCQGCAAGLENGTCPQCQVPAPPRDRQPDRIISGLIASCRDLRTLLQGGDVRVSQGREAPDHPLCTPDAKGPVTPQGKAPATTLSPPLGREPKGVKGININNNNSITKVAVDNANKRKLKRGSGNDGKIGKKPKSTPKVSSTKGESTVKKKLTSQKSSLSTAEKGAKVSVTSKQSSLMTPNGKKPPKVADLSALGMTPKTVAINKRNSKGETLLHVSCIKGDKERVAQLLSEGANPNTKDNAGWTPLHEVCSHGYEDIAELLLLHGAIVDAPGGSNECPLHDAVAQGQVGLIRLLRGWGASDTSRNLRGHTPRSIAALCNGAAELNEALDTPAKQCVPQVSIVPPLPDRMTLLGTGLNQEQCRKLDSLAKLLRAKVTAEFSPEVTHVVADCTQDRLVNERSVKYMMGVVSGKWILSHTWMDECLKTECAASPKGHEAEGCVPATCRGAPEKGRTNAEKLRPGLLSGCSVYLWGSFSAPHPSKKEVEGLVRAGGGMVLVREPNAESILEGERSVPFHTWSNGVFTDCSHYIIYPDSPSQPQIKYDMSHIKSLPLSWLYSCVDNFDLVAPIK